MTASALLAGYVNPLSGAKVAPHRIDMGVDYAGSGPLRAIGDAIITQVNPGGWNSGPGRNFGNFMEYQLTSGVLTGQYVYYAEGVNPTVKVGDKVKAGDVVANTSTRLGTTASRSAGDRRRTINLRRSIGRRLQRERIDRRRTIVL